MEFQHATVGVRKLKRLGATAAVTMALAANAHGQCGTWEPIGSGAYAGLRATAEYNGELYAAGYAGEQIYDAWIYAWNGSAWHGLGSGIHCSQYDETTISDLQPFNGELIVGGSFECIDNVVVNAVARWNGTDWQSLADGIYGRVYALTVYRDDLIAAGSFTMAGRQDAVNIARWNGREWLPLGNGVGYPTERIYALAVYQDELVAAGDFKSVGGMTVRNIARWNGQAWRKLGHGLSSIGNTYNDVRTLQVFHGNLIVGGSFSQAGGAMANNIARWNGTVWHALGSGANQSVDAMTVFNGMLVAGGTFSRAGGQPAKRVAAWDGLHWRNLGGGISCLTCQDLEVASPGVESLSIWNNDLIAGGTFNTADGQPAQCIARWSDCPPTMMIEPQFTSPLLITNPYSPFVSGGARVFTGQRDGLPASAFLHDLTTTRKFSLPSKRTVACRIIDTTEMVGGQLQSAAREFFAQANNGTIYQFGRIATTYSDGQVSHKDSWLVGGPTLASDPSDAAQVLAPGVFMPNQPELNETFRPVNMYPIAYETDRVTHVDGEVSTPLGQFNHAIAVNRSPDLHASGYTGSVEKWYAPGIGLVKFIDDESNEFVLTASTIGVNQP